MINHGLPLTESTAPDDDLAYFVEVFLHLFRAGIQYPLGHTLFDRLVDSCLQQLRVILGLEGSVDLEVDTQRLLLNNRHLAPGNADFLNLHILLQQAGVAEVCFDLSLTHSHLLLATRRLLTRRTEAIDKPAAESGGQRISAPCGITVRLTQEAVVPVADGPPDPLLLQITELATRLPKARGQRLQTEMTALLRRSALGMPGFPFATGRDATELLLTAVRAADLPEAVWLCGYGERDTAVLLSFVNALADLAFKVSQESQLGMLCRSWCKSMRIKARLPNPAPAMVRKERGVRSCSTSALQRLVSIQLGQSPQWAPMHSGNRRPMLSLVLQQIEPGSFITLTDAWQALLVALLQAPLEQRDWHVLKGALQERLEVYGVDHFHSLCTVVIPALRRSPALSPARCLLELWNALPATLHMHLWPYAADELLLSGMAGAKSDFYQLFECVGTMPMEVMNSQRFLLERQPAFSGQQLAPRVFCSAYTSTYRFFAFLLDTSLKTQIADAVITELRRNPQDELIAAVIFLLHPEEEAHVRFLANYLRHAHGEAFSECLTAAAARLMIELLPQLDERSKEEPWLERTISAMAKWHGEGTNKVLEKIVEERRFAIMPAWNKNCRRTAEIALECLRQRPVVNQLSRGRVQERSGAGPSGEGQC
jgi:hypothetical protein